MEITNRAVCWLLERYFERAMGPNCSASLRRFHGDLTYGRKAKRPDE